MREGEGQVLRVLPCHHEFHRVCVTGEPGDRCVAGEGGVVGSRLRKRERDFSGNVGGGR